MHTSPKVTLLEDSTQTADADTTEINHTRKPEKVNIRGNPAAMKSEEQIEKRQEQAEETRGFTRKNWCVQDEMSNLAPCIQFKIVGRALVIASDKNSQDGRHCQTSVVFVEAVHGAVFRRARQCEEVGLVAHCLKVATANEQVHFDAAALLEHCNRLVDFIQSAMSTALDGNFHCMRCHAADLVGSATAAKSRFVHQGVKLNSAAGRPPTAGSAVSGQRASI